MSQTFFFPLQTVFFFLTLHPLRHPQSLQKYKEHLKLRKIALSRVHFNSKTTSILQPQSCKVRKFSSQPLHLSLWIKSTKVMALVMGSVGSSPYWLQVQTRNPKPTPSNTHQQHKKPSKFPAKKNRHRFDKKMHAQNLYRSTPKTHMQFTKIRKAKQAETSTYHIGLLGPTRHTC